MTTEHRVLNFVFILTFIVCCTCRPHTPLRITKWATMALNDRKILNIFVKSVTDCVFECNRRPVCGSVNYNRRLALCEILSSTGTESDFSFRRDGSWQYVVRSVQVSELCNNACSDDELCDTDTKKCLKRECEPLSLPHGTLNGNMNTAGARLKIKCNFGYIESSSLTSTICLESGRWSHTPKCKRPMTADFDSSWRPIKASTLISESRLNVAHGLGEVPILVDVEVKAIDGDNKGFIFKATGHQIRDNDQPEDYGGVVYLYNDVYVSVSAPLKGNGVLGYAIYTGQPPFWDGSHQQASYQALVRVRAWKYCSLPKPDFSVKGIPVKSNSPDIGEMYISRPHGLGEYPSLVLARVRFNTADRFSNYYADSVGSTSAVYTGIRYTKHGYVVYGYNDTSVRVWIPSDIYGRIFEGGDGYSLSAHITSGSLEIVAWKSSTLPTIKTGTHNLGLTAGAKDMSGPIQLDKDYENTFLRAWVMSTSGINSGFRFVGSGALTYETGITSTPCSYGGLVYAYNATTIRYWKPGHGNGLSNGALVCISDSLANGLNAQATSDGVALYSVW